MAMGRYTRNDGKKSSSCCSTITIVVMVSACLIGAWIMMPSIMEPGVTKEFKQQKVMETNSRGFVDSYGRDEGESNSQREEIVNRESERSNEVDQEEKLEKDKSDEDEKSTSSDRKEEGLPSGDQGIGDRTGEDKFDTMDQKQSNENTDDSDQKQSNENTDDSDQKQSNKNTDDSDQKQSNENTEDIEHKSDENERNSGEGESSKEKIEETETQDEVDSKSLDKSKDTNEYSSERTTETGTTDQAEILNESSTQIGSWSTQSKESEKQKASVKFSLSKDPNSYRWKLCNVTAGPDYIPCLDNIKAIRKLPSTSHYEHRERHCPDEAPTCLVSLPEGYRTPVKWPKSREKIWFANVPHVKLAEVKGHQNWVQVSGDYLTFPGGGTQFTHGALHYIDFIQKTVSDIAWGKRTRVILDVGCGVASFGGYLFDRDVIAISLAPKDEHEAQTQFALERGIPAISAVMGTKRLPFPSRVFDIVHCARCRVPWHIEGGKLLLELNRVLRPGGFFVWSATPVYRTNPEDSGIWKAMSKLTKAMCWELVSIGKDKVNGVSAAVYRKPTSNECYETRARDDPPLCQESDDPNAAWDVPLQACIHKLPTDPSERGSQWPAKWPSRLEKTPYWLRSLEVGVYGKAAPKDFSDDYKHWKLLFANSYLNGIGIDWTSVRNVMDMRAVYGGFAAALKDLEVWVMNVVPISSSDTLPIIYERGLFGIYHDWCESFNTYPRTYDLLHADHLFSDITKRCEIVTVMAEVDRILRPEGKLIVKDDAETVAQVETMAKSLHWKILFTFSKDGEGLLSVQKTRWRPSDVETIYSAIA